MQGYYAWLRHMGTLDCWDSDLVTTGTCTAVLPISHPFIKCSFGNGAYQGVLSNTKTVKVFFSSSCDWVV